MPVKLCRWGHSLGLRLERYIIERTGLAAGDLMYVTLRDSGEIVIRPVKANEMPAGYATPLLAAGPKPQAPKQEW